MPSVSRSQRYELTLSHSSLFTLDWCACLVEHSVSAGRRSKTLDIYLNFFYFFFVLMRRNQPSQASHLTPVTSHCPHTSHLTPYTSPHLTPSKSSRRSSVTSTQATAAETISEHRLLFYIVHTPSISVIDGLERPRIQAVMQSR